MDISEIKHIKADEKEVRKFGFLIGTICALWGIILFLKRKDSFFCFAVSSVLFLLPAVARPVLLKPVYKVWMAMSMLLGWVMTKVILFLFFYVVFTPIAVLARLFGKRFLNMHLDKNIESYWIKKENNYVDKRDYGSQF